MKSGATPRLIVAVPVKDLTHAKQRLTSVLTPDEREELARAMLRDVLRALAGAHVDRVWVVTRDAAAAAIARELGAEPVLAAENRGHTASSGKSSRACARVRRSSSHHAPGLAPTASRWRRPTRCR